MAPLLKAVLKRGALITAANWQVVVVQFVVESAFKTLLVVPLAGAAFLLALLIGGSVGDVLARDPRELIGLVIARLAGHPSALAAYLAGLAIVIVGGSLLVVVVKAGTVPVLLDGEREAPPVEQPPLRLASVQAAGRFSIERFFDGIDRLGAGFVRLGLLLLVVYAISAGLYTMVVLAGVRALGGAGLAVAATLWAATASLALVAWILLVNLAYLLTQVALASGSRSIPGALRDVAGFVGRQATMVASIFLVVLALAVLATIASVLVTALVGFIGFVPFIGIAVFPLQLLAWLGRGLLFQYLGLAALTAHAHVYREAAAGASPNRLAPSPPEAHGV